MDGQYGDVRDSANRERPLFSTTAITEILINAYSFLMIYRKGMVTGEDVAPCYAQTILQVLQDGDSWTQLLERVQAQCGLSSQRVYELANVCLSGGEMFAKRETGRVCYYHRRPAYVHR